MYVEITGLVWMLVAASARALELSASEALIPQAAVKTKTEVVKNPYMVYR
jgi:hypothetical protein